MIDLPLSFTLQIQTIVSLAFLVMWLTDKSKTSLLWWAVAHLCLIGMTGLTSILYTFENDVPLWFTLIFNLVLAFNTTALLVAASYYRTFKRLAKYFIYSGFLYTSVLVAFTIIFGQGYMQVTAIITMAMAFFFTALLFWNQGLLGQITSAFFVFRAFNAFYFLTSSDFPKISVITTLPSSTFILTLISVLLLLLTMFQSSQNKLKNHIGFLSLTQAFSRVLEGVTDAKQAGDRLIKLFLERQVWSNVGLFAPDKNQQKLYPVTGAGDNFFALQEKLLKDGLPIEGTLGGKAFTSKKLVCDYDIYSQNIIPKLGLSLKTANFNVRTTQVVVPLQHDQKVYGVLIVNRAGHEKLSDEEMNILENIGQLMGLTLANIQHMDELSYSASHDSLTGLSNRTALHSYFSSQPEGACFVLMLFDLNHFKEVNDTLGHGVGDSLLCALARRLEEQLASESIKVYRLGGDEFVVSYEVTQDGPPKEELAAELSRLIADVIYIDDLALRTTASIGVVESKGRTLNSHELLRCADLAMYQAKSQGSPIAYYEKETDNEVQKRVAIIEGIARAIEQDQLELAFQPIVDLRQSQCVKCEALIRWRHPEDGVITAAKFMPIIETTHMISSITRIVAQKAFDAVKQWQDVTVSINLSARNLLDEKLVDFLLEAVKTQLLNPALIQFEITETMLMADHAASELVLNRLVDAGFTIALDDFGTGYSSLAYLSHFPIHTLKIDGSFIRKMLTDKGTRSIVESTIELCHKLGLDVVAEGVETTSEAEALERMGCHFAQGYFYAKPLPETQFSEWLTTHSHHSSKQ